MQVSKEVSIKFGMDMVIMDAIEQGHTDPKELIEFMKQPEFEKAVKGYAAMLENELNKPINKLS